jgi:uncharacterized protein (DUF983 family)
MSSTGLHVSCPHCGFATETTAGLSQSSDRLKGAAASCSDCENGFELYYY